MVEPEVLQAELRALAKRHGLDMVILHVFKKNAIGAHDVRSVAVATNLDHQSGINRVCKHQIDETMKMPAITQVKPTAVWHMPKSN